MSTLYIPPKFQAVLNPVTELVTTACTMCTIDAAFTSTAFKLGPRVLEVEARLGKQGPDGFSNGITADMFYAVLNKLESFKGWVKASTEWETVHDYTYTVDDHVIRTRKVFAPDTPVEHVIKKRLKNVDVYFSGTPPALFSTLDIRTSLSSEQHVVLPEGFTVQPELVSRKLQKQFQYKSWLFVVSKTQRPGPTASAVETFEVELEYVSVNQAIGNTSLQQYIALGLLMKLVDFYPTFDTPYMLLPVATKLK